MAKRRPIPPFTTLPEYGVVAEPDAGWEFHREGFPPVVVGDGQLFPSWDSALKFSLRRRLVINPVAAINVLGLTGSQCRLGLCTRLDTGRGLYSEVVDRREISEDEQLVEIVVSPDSVRLSRDISLTTTLVLAADVKPAKGLSPAEVGSKVWESRWTSKLEGGRARLPIEAISFTTGMRGVAGPNALFQVVVTDYADLEFEQAVCVYLNADFPQFIAAIEMAEPAATTMLWDGVMRQILSSGLTGAFADEGESWVEGSAGHQIRTWLASIFSGQSTASIASLRKEDPGAFEARVQSWVRAGPMWPGANK